MAINKRVKPLLVSNREFKRLLIPRDDEHFAHTIQQHRTTATMGKMTFNLAAHLAVHVAFDVGGQIAS
ncbi:MAG: hypothetical protein ABI072_07730 [Edaphobacter sp.]